MIEQVTAAQLFAAKRDFCFRCSMRAARYWIQGDLPNAQSFFAVARELWEEAEALRKAGAATEQAVRQHHTLGEGRSVFNHWYERV